jgi:anti-sigma factor (TIGR02949 family)
MSDEPVISCEEALVRLADFLTRELDPSERAEVERHVDHCRSCCSRTEFERLLKQRLTELGSEKAPADLQARIRKLVRGF